MFNPYQNNYYRQPAAQGDDVKVVNGRQSAEQYMMYPNSRVLLLDANADRFYLKETDASGVSRIRTYEFKEVVDPPAITGNYVTMEQLEEVLKKYEFNPKPQISNQQSSGNQSSATTTQF